MCIDFMDTTPVVVLCIYKMIFVFTKIVCILQVQVSALRKNRSLRVPVQYSI